MKPQNKLKHSPSTKKEKKKTRRKRKGGLMAIRQHKCCLNAEKKELIGIFHQTTYKRNLVFLCFFLDS